MSLKQKSVATRLLFVALSLALVYSLVLFAGCGSSSSSSDSPTPTPTPTAQAPAIADYARTPISAFRTNTDYIYIHGNASPDGSKLYVALNETTAGNGGSGAAMTGKFTSYLLKMSDVTAGTVTSASALVTSQTISAAVAFRSSWTPDGTKIVQAGADRVVVLKASDLSELANDTDITGTADFAQNHDALAIDNNYALLSMQMRVNAGEQLTGGIELYDLNAKKRIGNPVDMCSACHDHASITTAHTLCGIDGKLTKSGSTFTGKLYVAATSGGHIGVVDVTIDPTNTTTPIVVNSATRIQITANAPAGATSTMPAFHDVRLDTTANRVYYSAIKVDGTSTADAGRAHIGYVDLADTNASTRVHDGTINATTAAQSGLVYCGSGQTTDFFIPMTMSYPAYIDAVPKTVLRTGATLNP